MSTDSDTERALALKAIVQYVVGRKGTPQVSLDDIAKAHPNQNLEACRNFMRSNASSIVYEQEFPGIQTAIDAILKTHAIRLPAHFEPVARFAGINLEDTRAQRYGLSVLDYVAPYDHIADIRTLESLLRQYEGCWRIYRISSSTDRTSADGDGYAEVKINRSLLNIKPLHVLQESRQSLPLFSLYQASEDTYPVREDTIDDRYRPISRTVGYFLRTGERLTLLAERDRLGAGANSVGLMTWFHSGMRPIDTDARAPLSGIYCLPNSDGRRFVSSYFVGHFVDGSDRYSKQEYESFKRDELRTIGPIKFNDIAKAPSNLTDPSLANLLRTRLIDKSRKDVVLEV